MSDLRERIWDVVRGAVDFASDATLAENTAEGNERTDAVLAVFAAWLRELADLSDAQDTEDVDTSVTWPASILLAGDLRRLADAVAPKGAAR